MKKIKFILIFTCAFFFISNAFAQKVSYTGSSSGVALDTVVNTGTIYLTSPYLYSSSWKDGAVIQLDATNISGTSTVTAILQSSLDGTTWENHFKTPGQTGVNCDTLAITGTTMHLWNILPKAAATYSNIIAYSNSGRRLYYRIKLTGAATGVTKVTAISVPQ